jgi:hypothetical protein
VRRLRRWWRLKVSWWRGVLCYDDRHNWSPWSELVLHEYTYCYQQRTCLWCNLTERKRLN